MGQPHKSPAISPKVLWPVLIVVILGIAVGGFFLLNSYIYNEKQGDDTTVSSNQNKAEVDTPVALPDPSYEYSYVEDFSSKNLNDGNVSTANWDTEKGLVNLLEYPVTQIDSDYFRGSTTNIGDLEIKNLGCAQNFCLLIVGRGMVGGNKIVKYSDGNFDDVTSIFINDSEDRITAGPFVAENIIIECNDSQCVLGNVDWSQSKFAFYDGSVAVFTEVKGTNDSNIIVTAMGWNGNYWLFGTSAIKGPFNSPAYLIKYENGIFSDLVEVFDKNDTPQIEEIQWNGTEWMIGGYGQVLNNDNDGTEPLTFMHPAVGVFDDVRGFTQLSDELLNIDHNIVRSILWDGSDWLIGIGSILYNDPENATLLSYGDHFQNISDNLVNFTKSHLKIMDDDNGDTFFVGTYSRSINVRTNNTYNDLSSRISGDLYSAYYHDGKVYLGGKGKLYMMSLSFPESQIVQSTKINTLDTNILSASITADQETPGDTAIDYYLSNDGGETWESVAPGKKHTFTSTGSDLRWKAELKSNDGTNSPSIEQLEITYTIQPNDELEGAAYGDYRDYKTTDEQGGMFYRSEPDGGRIIIDTPFTVADYHARSTQYGVLFWKKGETKSKTIGADTEYPWEMKYEEGVDPEPYFYRFDTRTFKRMPNIVWYSSDTTFDRVYSVTASSSEEKVLIEIGAYDTESESFQPGMIEEQPVRTRGVVYDIGANDYTDEDPISRLIEVIDNEHFTSTLFQGMTWDSERNIAVLVPYGEGCGAYNVITFVNLTDGTTSTAGGPGSFTFDKDEVCNPRNGTSSNGQWFVLFGKNSAGSHDAYLFDTEMLGEPVASIQGVEAGDRYWGLNNAMWDYSGELPKFTLPSGEVFDFNN